MRKLALISSILISTTGLAQMSNTLEYNTDKLLNSLKKATENFTFNYYVKYLGPSLGSGHKSGETFDRFNSGQNYTGGNIDPNGSYEVYQSFRLGYRFKNNAILSYGVTFQEDLYNAEAKTYDPKGNRLMNNTYKKGYSDNNHRISYWMPLYSNSTFFISASTYYEIPTTKSSQESDMKYGVGIQPTLGFFNNNPSIMMGVNFSFERDFYKRNQQDIYFSDGSKSDYPQKYQVARVLASPYFNYILNDKVLLKSALIFDWDQQGNQADTTDFNKNMVDIANLGISYSFSTKLKGEFFVEAAIEEMSLNRTATGLALTLSI